MTGLATFGYRSPWQCKVFAMDTLIMEDFRCFAGRHEIPLAPLTLLVGENSSGKTSFLAAVRLAWDATHERSEWINFNEEPFPLGTFRDIARKSGARGPRASEFALGLTRKPSLARPRVQPSLVPVPGDRPIREVAQEVRFVEDAGLATAGTRIIRSPLVSVRLRPEKKGRSELEIRTQSADPAKIPPELESLPPWADWYYVFRRIAGADRRGQNSLGIPTHEFEELGELLESTRLRDREATRPYAFAPVRSRPLRSYSPFRDVPDPEGQHVPLVLARALGNRSEGDSALAAALALFGRSSGLFDSIQASVDGKKPGNPFEILVKRGSVTRNLVDIGYGVSQVLPILVEIFTSPPGGTFLVQQPEVHLHPKAQAALSSLFGQLAAGGRQLIVETHSDYIVDRIRMDIRDGKGVTSEDVSLLYFEPTKHGAKIHRLRFTEDGEVCGVGEAGEDTDVPPGYRAFFLKESLRLYTGVS